jgi:hypothetical protein
MIKMICVKPWLNVELSRKSTEEAEPPLPVSGGFE